MLRRKPAALGATMALALSAAGPALAAEDIDLDADLGSGVTVYTELSANGRDAREECLSGITKWRRDAIEDNVRWVDEGVETTIPRYLADHGISEDDYLDPAWSTDLEYVSLERSAEAALLSDKGERTNGEEWNTVVRRGVTPRAEVQASQGDCRDWIDNYADQKSRWVNEAAGPVDRYLFLIDPNNRAYGAAGYEYVQRFVSSTYTEIWTAQATDTVPSDVEPIEPDGPRIIPVNITEDDAAKGADFNIESVNAGDTVAGVARAKAYQGGVFFRGEWSSSNEEIATVDSTGHITGVAAGEVDITLAVPGGPTFTFPVTVVDKTITEVDLPRDVYTESGDAPRLPDRAGVTYDDGSTGSASVTWDLIDKAAYSGRDDAMFTVKGKVFGWAELEEIRVKVKRASVEKFTPEKVSRTTELGTPPKLPETVTATWTNGDVTTETIDWERIPAQDYSDQEGDVFTVKGHVPRTSDRVLAEVTVGPATKVSATSPDSDVNTIVGQSPQLPETVVVTWSDGNESEEQVTWEEIDKAQLSEPGSFNVSGTVEGLEDPIVVHVVVTEKSIDGAVLTVDRVDVISGDYPDGYPLPETATVTWSDGEQTTEPITWSDYDKDLFMSEGGALVPVIGTIAGWDGELVFTINILPPEPRSVEQLNQVVETEAGTPATLAANAMVTYSDGSVREVAIDWEDVDPASYEQPGEYVVHGTAAGLKVEQKVIVLPKSADGPDGNDPDPSQPPAPGTDEPAPGHEKPDSDKSGAKKPADQPKGHHGKSAPKYGKDLPHTGADVALLGILSLLLIAAGTALTRRYRRGR